MSGRYVVVASNEYGTLAFGPYWILAAERIAHEIRDEAKVEATVAPLADVPPVGDQFQAAQDAQAVRAQPR